MYMGIDRAPGLLVAGVNCLWVQYIGGLFAIVGLR